LLLGSNEVVKGNREAEDGEKGRPRDYESQNIPEHPHLGASLVGLMGPQRRLNYGAAQLYLARTSAAARLTMMRPSGNGAPSMAATSIAPATNTA
jgi:hypothetical protein